MDQNTDPVSSNSNLCRSGCGFYGSSSTNGLCSKCHKDAVKRKQATPNVSVPASTSGKEETPSRSPTENNNGQKSIDTAVPTVQLASPLSTQLHEAGSSNSLAESQSISDEIASTSSNEVEALQEDQKRKNRCKICRRKLGLTGFHCRCGGSFCSVHRYANEHDCTFDYKSLGAQEIKKNNPVVVAEKIKKI